MTVREPASVPDAAPSRQYAVQKPKGRGWETLVLVPSLDEARRAFEAAVAAHGTGYVRLVQVDFKDGGALADYDWRQIDLHDPSKGQARPRPTVVAGTERVTTRRGDPAKRPGRGGRKPSSKLGAGAFPPGKDDRVPIPVAGYVMALLFGALTVIVWFVAFRT